MLERTCTAPVLGPTTTPACPGVPPAGRPGPVPRGRDRADPVRSAGRILRLLSACGALPLVFWAAGDAPSGPPLRDALSAATLVAFGLSLGLFYLVRANRRVWAGAPFGRLVRWHRAVGSGALALLLAHPFLLVVPRFFQAGVRPGEAWWTLVTAFGSRGVVYGLVAWGLALALGVTAWFRRRLPLGYPAWLALHGALALGFGLAALAHVLDLGRHVTPALATALLLLAAGGLALWVKGRLAAPQPVRGIR